ncbi:glucosaminidase domain-containing protein [Ulvibacter litoralis]|uniref:Peptidoglycan hydrolase n=1 Tax=Ulvibacter litoralis TaxID=227084 RepID=A0A1G7GD55_9FLAO|nr:glucosaminidase domain-containing protein [Ulvibacter litoralis]GHC56680.1 hemagglutinin [Ulvibacter litoralis]SDE86088.1 Flagellum-specific peptidoglycan hydrolase FlgJ [Ulvibacter litoralis]
MQIKIIGCLVILVLAFTGCKAKKNVSTTKKRTKTERVVKTKKPKTTTPTTTDAPTVIVKPSKTASYAEVVTAYIDSYSTIAKEEMLQYGIPASITLAQGILESGAGRGELTGKANNHFGIKCHKGWEGERVYHDDDESQECFRKYKDPKYSFRDHSLFLTQRSRYQDLFKLRKDDYKGWARGLRKAGYATDPKYPEKLISIVERYDLTKYDSDVLGTTVNPVRPDDTKIATYKVRKGDTLYNISRRYNMSVETLKEYNGLQSNEISIGQELYLHPVKN